MVGYQQKLKRAFSSNDAMQPDPEPERPSCLANHLLLLWGRGEISATALQKLAHASMLDGCLHCELVAFASFGNYGQYPANITRDLKSYLERSSDITYPLPVELSTEMIDPKTSRIEEGIIFQA